MCKKLLYLTIVATGALAVVALSSTHAAVVAEDEAVVVGVQLENVEIVAVVVDIGAKNDAEKIEKTTAVNKAKKTNEDISAAPMGALYGLGDVQGRFQGAELAIQVQSRNLSFTQAGVVVNEQAHQRKKALDQLLVRYDPRGNGALDVLKIVTRPANALLGNFPVADSANVHVHDTALIRNMTCLAESACELIEKVARTEQHILADTEMVHCCRHVATNWSVAYL
jgi:hypothetical protein